VNRALPAVLDVALVVLFAALGRRSHADGLDVVGVLRTAAPFVAGAAAGWLVASLTLDAAPRDLSFGAVVLVCTVVVGMLLRRVMGDGTALSFVLVATTVLSVLLLGWRLVARMLG
jgi:ribose/xylose/arabinose/galactoside ABC-type transport system permease subunit